MVDTLPNGFTVGCTFGCRLFPVSPPHANTVNQVTLLGLVAEPPCLVRARWAGRTVDDGELTVFPASDSGDELQDVRLLFGVKLLEIFVGTHLSEASALRTSLAFLFSCRWNVGGMLGGWILRIANTTHLDTLVLDG